MARNTIDKNSIKNTDKKADETPKKKYTTVNGIVINYKTHDGHKLTVKEAKYIDLYIETGNGRQSVIEAGYQTKAPGQYAQTLMNKDYVRSEIEYRLKKLEDEKIASAQEILQYFTGVMRGEIKDQFGLDTPLSERTKAAQELAKRKIDIAEKVAGKKEGDGTITIKLDWSNAVSEDKEEQEEEANENEQ